MAEDSPEGEKVDVKQWTRIVLILAATLYILQGGDPSSLPMLGF